MPRKMPTKNQLKYSSLIALHTYPIQSQIKIADVNIDIIPTQTCVGIFRCKYFDVDTQFSSSDLILTDMEIFTMLDIILF